MVNHYKNNQYSLKLLGSKNIILNLQEIYIEPGYVAYDRNGNDVTSKVKITGKVNTNLVGTYKIEYQIGKIKEYRVVIINDDLSLNLLDNSTDYVLKNNTYIPSECKAFDKIDGDISNKIIINNPVNTNVEGNYIVEYSVTNSRGVKKTIQKDVIVYDIKYIQEQKIVEDKYLIEISFIDDNYLKAILPDNTITFSKNISYTFLENGNYTINVYDKYDNIKKININVAELDKTPPTGSCVVNLYDYESKIITNINDNQGIKEYIYHYGNKNSGAIKNKEFTYTDDTSEAKVIAYDNSNNKSEFVCSVNDLSTKYSRSYETKSNNLKYKLYIPGSLTKRNKLPLVIYLHSSGDCGNDIENVNNTGLPKLIKNGRNYDFLMVAPLMGTNYCKSWDFPYATVKSLIDDVVNNYPVDPERIIISGFSVGANNTLTMIRNYPNFFAGAIPIGIYRNWTFSEIFNQTDIWAFFGEHDNSLEYGQNIMETVISKNPNSKITVIKNGDHDVTLDVFQNSNVIKWILSQKKDK